MSQDKLRSCVGALVFNQNNEVLVCQRSSKKKTAVGKWQFPQGGVESSKDEDKDFYSAVLREIKEEIGLDPPTNDSQLKFVSKIENPLSYKYEFRNSITKALGQTFGNIGQMIHWHIFYLPKESIGLIDLGFEDKPEFDECKWFSFNDFINNQQELDNDNNQTQPVPFKIEMYKQLFLVSQPIINQFLENQNKI